VLGALYKYGRGGVAENFAQAVALYRLAAAQNLDGAQSYLGRMYDDGHGVAEDSAEALQLDQLAAAQDILKHCSLSLPITRTPFVNTRPKPFDGTGAHKQAAGHILTLQPLCGGCARDDSPSPSIKTHVARGNLFIQP
jgi:hypothetical protein